MEDGARVPRGQPGGDAGALQRASPRSGEDPDFHKQPEFVAPQDKGPWGAFDLSLGKAMYSGFTMGGLAISVDGQVLRDDGSVVPGLYAVGACASNIAQDGKGYASGTQLGEGSFFGRRAGAHAAAGRASALSRRRWSKRARRTTDAGSLLTGPSRHGPPPSSFEVSFVEQLDGGSMADADHDAIRQFVAQQLVQRVFQPFVERRRAFVEEDRLGFGEQDRVRRPRVAAHRGRAPWPSHALRRDGRTAVPARPLSRCRATSRPRCRPASSDNTPRSADVPSGT